MKKSFRLLGAGVVALVLTVAGGAQAQGEAGSIRVLKVASSVGGTVFEFELEGPGVLEEFTLLGGESETIDGLAAGTYIVRETVPEDWELAAISCGIFFGPGPVASGALQIELMEGEDILCQFFNSSLVIPPPPPPPEAAIPALSPTGVSILFMVLAAAGGALISRLR